MKDFTEIAVRSTVDGSKEPSLLYIPETAHEKTVPLVVGLHTWSYDRFNKMDAYLPFCKSRGWALLLPEFRGPNLRTNPRGAEACAQYRTSWMQSILSWKRGMRIFPVSFSLGLPAAGMPRF